MKIAIVTVYDSIVNYGSFLQAYALQCVLEEMGHSVYFVRRMEDEEILKRFNKISWRNINSKKIKFYDIPRKANRILKQVREIKRNHQRYICSQKDWEMLHIISISDMKKLGIKCIVCGSDEIWNVHNRDIDLDFYTCKWAKQQYKIAYAISAGNTVEKDLPISIKKSIQTYDACLPRDENTYRLLNSIGAAVWPIVCDPTILYGKEKYNIQTKYNLGRYMLVYSYTYTSQQIKLLKRFAKEHSLKIISPCISADFADENIFTSALDFPALIAGAECMFTATFHGTIFGLMYAKKLCCFPKLDKIKTIIKLCGGEEYAISNNAEYEEMSSRLELLVNHEKIDNLMAQLRSDSMLLLSNTLMESADEERVC